MKTVRILSAILIVLGLTGPVWAGQTCIERAPTPVDAYRALELAERTFEALDASGAEVAIVARSGQDLSRYGLNYSHLGLVWRDHPEGRWTVVHLLNECGTDHAALFNQGLGDFFLDGMAKYKTLLMIPDPIVGARLALALADHHAADLFTPQYNMLAYPFATQYENSNQWALEFIAPRLANNQGLTTRETVQAWLRVARYRPTTIHLSALERLGAEVSRTNVRFDDHPFERRMAGEIDTVTVESVETFLRMADPGLREITLSVEDPRA